MKKFLVALLVICMAAYSKQQDDECGPNAVYNQCGSACPAACNSAPRPQPCVTVCVPGCFCEKGYVFRSLQSRQCILRKDCPR